MSIFLAALNLIDPNTDHIPTTQANNATLHKILTLTFVITGAIALMMLVIAGFRYTISAGDPNKMAESRRMIIYTAIGLIVSAMAVTIVNAVLGKAANV